MKNPWDIEPLSLYGSKRKKKRKSYTPASKVRLWQTLSHVCHICHKRINDYDAGELDHVRAYSKGGSTMRWAHRSCNRIKGNKGLAAAQKALGVKRKPKKRKTTRHKKSRGGLWDNPFSGYSIKQPKWGL